MKKNNVNRNTRLLLLIASLSMWMGIWLSGFENVHWFIFFVPTMFLIGAGSGFCGLMNMIEKVFGKEE